MTSPSSSNDAWIVETRPETFDQDVFDRSHAVPVVVDFWAAWCGPCRMLTPVLEGLAQEHAGRFALVKANTDENPEAAAQFQVQGIPAVFAVVDGAIVDAFTGALPEPQIRAWLDRLAQTSDLAAAQRLEDQQPTAAEASYRALLEQWPNLAEAQVGLARTLFAQERFEDCRAILTRLEDRGFLEPEAEKLKAALELRARSGADLAQRRSAAAADPSNLTLQLELAEALAGAQLYEEALRVGLHIVQQDKQGQGQAARQLMVDVFRVLPDDSSLASDYRRKLSRALY